MGVPFWEYAHLPEGSMPTYPDVLLACGQDGSGVVGRGGMSLVIVCCRAIIL